MVTKGNQVYIGKELDSVAFVNLQPKPNPNMTTSSLTAPDLTRRAPRSPRTRLGGYSHLPRLLDKCRAGLAGLIGEYDYNCPRDQQFFAFSGIDAEALKVAAATGKGDQEMLEWVQANAGKKRDAWEIQAWSEWMDNFNPASDPGTAGFFANALAQLSTARKDIHSWSDLLELDDHCSFGGQA